MQAASFSILSSEGRRIARALEETRARVPRAGGALLFVGGASVPPLAVLAEDLRGAAAGLPLALAQGAGVLTERGELEGTDGAAGLVWSGGGAEPFVASGDERSSVARAIGERLKGRRGGVAVFARPGGFSPDQLSQLELHAPGAHVFGGGTVGRGAMVLDASGASASGVAVGLVLTGLVPPVIEASPAGKLMTELAVVDEAVGAVVLRVGGEPALDALGAAARRVGRRTLVFAALSSPELAAGEGRFVLRPLRGIDPGRRAVVVSDEVRPGTRLGFAVLDAGAARADLEEATRRLARSTAGAAPRFAVLMSCAGRGAGLYGAPDVDVRAVRERFAELPLAGMHSSFELATLGPGAAAMQLYAGVVALFRAPS